MTLRNIGAYELAASQLAIARYGSLVTVERVMADNPTALAAAAAPMYSHTGSGSCGGGIVPCTRLLDLARGIDFQSKRVDSGVTLSIVGGKATAAQGSAVAPGASVAVQLYPTLVWNGRPSGGGSESSVAGLGLLQNGRLLYLVASGGSLADLAAEFVRRGAVAAGYTDAGSSAALYVRGSGWKGVHARAPKLPGWLLVMPPPPLLGSREAITCLVGVVLGGTLAAVLS